MKASDYISQFLYAQGIRVVFELVGGMTTHIIDSISREGKIRLVSMHHEQAAAFAADAAARMTGVPGVALATSGPGATNLLTGIGSCYFDSSPAVFITGQVNRHEQKGSRAIRQLGFQETDIVSMARPITKATWQVASPEDLPVALEQAFAIARSGRPGPVLLDIPMDIQRSEISAESPPVVRAEWDVRVDQGVIADLFSDLRASHRPLVLAGGGIRAAQATALFRCLVEELGIPVVHSLMAVDVLPSAHPLCVGMIGSYGNRWANLSVGRSDFLLVLGSRLDIRQTGSDTVAFKDGRIIYHVDCEPGEINNRVDGCRAVDADLRSFLTEAIRLAKIEGADERPGWLTEIDGLRRTWPDTAELRDIQGVNPNELMHRLSEVSGAAAAFVVDVGQHQMWAAQSLTVTANQRFITSGGMGAMGFALPAAVGASLTREGEPVVLIAGDGGFQLNIQEIQTVVRNKLPVKLVILNNQTHGMVRQFQQSYFGERYQSTYWGYSAPVFSRVASAYGLASRTVSAPEDVDDALRWLWKYPAEPTLLEVMIDTFANVYPKIAFGKPITEMEPLAKPVAMEGT